MLDQDKLGHWLCELFGYGESAGCLVGSRLSAFIYFTLDFCSFVPDWEQKAQI